MTTDNSIQFDVTKHEDLYGYTNYSDEAKAYKAWFDTRPPDEIDAMEREASEHRSMVYEEQQAREERQDRIHALAKAGVPKRAMRLIFADKLSETTAMKAAREFQESDDTSLVLLGPAGVGKSVAAAWLAACSIDYVIGGRPRPNDFDRIGEPSSGMFASASDIARVSMFDDKAMKELETVRYLVLDDLGVEFNDKSGSFLSRFDSLFNRRYSNELTTVITTNLTAEDFRDRYGERAVDRIRETGSFIGLDGKSLRQQ